MFNRRTGQSNSLIDDSPMSDIRLIYRTYGKGATQIAIRIVKDKTDLHTVDDLLWAIIEDEGFSLVTPSFIKPDDIKLFYHDDNTSNNIYLQPNDILYPIGSTQSKYNFIKNTIQIVINQDKLLVSKLQDSIIESQQPEEVVLSEYNYYKDLDRKYSGIKDIDVKEVIDYIRLRDQFKNV